VSKGQLKIKQITSNNWLNLNSISYNQNNCTFNAANKEGYFCQNLFVLLLDDK